MIHSFTYAVQLVPAVEGGFVVTCRDLPEVVTQGEDESDALVQALDAVEEGIAGRIRRKASIPAPTKPIAGDFVVALPAPMAAKAALFLAMEASGWTIMDLARRLACDHKEARRMLDPRHPTKLPRLEAALGALGKRIVVNFVDIPELRQVG